LSLPEKRPLWPGRLIRRQGSRRIRALRLIAAIWLIKACKEAWKRRILSRECRRVLAPLLPMFIGKRRRKGKNSRQNGERRVRPKAAGRCPNNRRLAARAPQQAFSAAVAKDQTAGIAAIR